jgi:hypothetical protein
VLREVFLLAGIIPRRHRPHLRTRQGLHDPSRNDRGARGRDGREAEHGLLVVAGAARPSRNGAAATAASDTSAATYFPHGLELEAVTRVEL